LTAPPDFDARFLDQLDALFAWRRDVRRFRRDPIEESEIAALIETACRAPSVGNAQPWRFVHLRSPALRETLAEHVDAESRRAGARYADADMQARYLSLKLHGLREAPVLLAVCSDERPAAGHGLGIATMPEALRYSTVMAIHTLWLAARARGIGMGWVSILDPETVGGLLDLPPDWTLIALLCIGYPEEEQDVPELARAGWQSRLPVSEMIFER